MAVGEQRTFAIRGGKLPLSAKVFGTGTVSVSGRNCIFTAAGLIDSPASITIDAIGVETQSTPISGLALWLKADPLSYANGNEVTTWNDSSGSGRDFVAGNVGLGNVPTFVSGFLNTQPVISFNGSNHYL
jgi:hypothetical protein